MGKFFRTVFLVDLIQGLWVTFRNQNPKYIYTEQYPAAPTRGAERPRGAPSHKINRDTGKTLGSACTLGAVAPPETLIVAPSERNEQPRRKELTTFTYDTSRCM